MRPLPGFRDQVEVALGRRGYEKKHVDRYIKPRVFTFNGLQAQLQGLVPPARSYRFSGICSAEPVFHGSALSGIVFAADCDS